MACLNCQDEVEKLNSEIARLMKLLAAYGSRTGNQRAERDAMIVNLDREGRSVGQIAKLVLMSKTGVHNVLKRERGTSVVNRIIWTEEMDTSLRGLRAAGVSITAIARRFGISHTSVVRRMGELNLKMPRGGSYYKTKP